MLAMWVVNTFICRSHTLMCSTKGENFVDSGIKILIAVVIGALLLGGLYALFGATRCCIVNAQGAARTPPIKALTGIRILPTLTEKVEEMYQTTASMLAVV